MFERNAFGDRKIVFPDMASYQPEPDMPRVELYADGSVDSNPGPGGWGVVLRYGDTVKVAAGHIEHCTNNVAEIQAVIEGLRRLKKPCRVTVFSDSQYVVKCGSGEYKISANEEVWLELFEVGKPHEVRWQWVRGHNGNEWQERSHELALEAMQNAR